MGSTVSLLPTILFFSVGISIRIVYKSILRGLSGQAEGGKSETISDSGPTTIHGGVISMGICWGIVTMLYLNDASFSTEDSTSSNTL